MLNLSVLVQNLNLLVWHKPPHAIMEERNNRELTSLHVTL